MLRVIIRLLALAASACHVVPANGTPTENTLTRSSNPPPSISTATSDGNGFHKGDIIVSMPSEVIKSLQDLFAKHGETCRADRPNVPRAPAPNQAPGTDTLPRVMEGVNEIIDRMGRGDLIAPFYEQAQLVAEHQLVHVPVFVDAALRETQAMVVYTTGIRILMSRGEVLRSAIASRIVLACTQMAFDALIPWCFEPGVHPGSITIE